VSVDQAVDQDKEPKSLEIRGNGIPGQQVNAVNGLEYSDPLHGPDLDDGVPPSLRRCAHCSRGDRVERWDLNGRIVWLHEACTSAWDPTGRFGG
jgi:hypothetical protein